MKYARLFFIVASVIAMIILLCSCGANYNLGKAAKFEAKKQRHLQLAIAKGAKVSTDSLFKNLKVKFEAQTVDHGFKPIPRAPEDYSRLRDTSIDTVDYSKDGVETKIIYKRDSKGTPTDARPVVKCPERVKEVKVPYAVKQDISAGFNGWQMAIACLISLVVGMVIQRLRNKGLLRIKLDDHFAIFKPPLP